MNVVFLSPNFPPNYYLFPVRLREQGASVLAIGDQPAEALRPELREALADYAQLHDLEDYEAVLRAVGLFTWRHGRISRVESNNEHWLPLEARLREDFNIPGQRPADLDMNRSKSAMKAVLARAGLPHGPGELIDSPDQARSFAAAHGFPLILKPDIGVGAAGTFRVDDAPALDEALTRLPPGYVIEKFLVGELLSFDGLTDREGQIAFCTSHRFNDGIMQVVSGAGPMHYWSVRAVPADLERLGRAVVAAFGIRERFFHIEFFRLADGSLRVLEVNFRPPGGFTTEMMNYAADIDVYRIWASIVTGRYTGPGPFERKYHVAHVGRRHGRRYATPHEELLRRLDGMLLLHQPMPAVLSGAMGDYCYLLRSGEAAQLQQAIRIIEAEAA